MNRPESDPLSEVDALVAAHLARQAAALDPEAGLARVRAARMRSQPAALPAWGRLRSRLALAAGVAAALALAFVGGWYFGPVRANARELVQEARRVHNLPLERCYLVETRLLGQDTDDHAALGPGPRQVRVWTRGDRFWAEVRPADSAAPFVWGRESDGALWAVLDANRGVRIAADQAPRPLTILANVCSLNLDTLLGDVLRDCTLTETPAPASKWTRVLTARPNSERTHLWLEQGVLEIDAEAKVLRRLVLTRNRRAVPFAEVTFTLVETRQAESARYQLEGHLAAPFRIHQGPVEPRIKLELLGRWLEMRAGQPSRKENKQPEAGGDETPIKLRDVEDRTHTLPAPPGCPATVCFFLLPDCPISNAYAPEIQRIGTTYGPKQIALFVVHADPDLTAERAKKHAREYGLTCPVLLDPSHQLVKRTGVTVAPEVAVLAPGGKVLYRGRIDDWYADFGKRRAEPSQRDLRNALDALLQGKPIPVPTTKPIGCYLPEPKSGTP